MKQNSIASKRQRRQSKSSPFAKLFRLTPKSRGHQHHFPNIFNVFPVSPLNGARRYIGWQKSRFQQDGFDLDLSYITPQCIAMSLPALGTEAVYRNPMGEVRRFFSKYHHGGFLIFNLCEEREYDPRLFDGKVRRIPVQDHNPPFIGQIIEFLECAGKFVDERPNNVIAVHCKGGKGRTGIMICCWLMYSSICSNANEALNHFAKIRTAAAASSVQGVSQPSQIRYVKYIEKLLKVGGYSSPKIVMSTIFIQSYPGAGRDSSLWFTVEQSGSIVFDNRRVNTEIERDTMENSVLLILPGLHVQGDIRIKFYSSKLSGTTEIFFFWFHTGFVSHEKLRFYKNEIDIACHDRKCLFFPCNFHVEMSFELVSDTHEFLPVSNPSGRVLCSAKCRKGGETIRLSQPENKDGCMKCGAQPEPSRREATARARSSARGSGCDVFSSVTGGGGCIDRCGRRSSNYKYKGQPSLTTPRRSSKQDVSCKKSRVVRGDPAVQDLWDPLGCAALALRSSNGLAVVAGAFPSPSAAVDSTRMAATAAKSMHEAFLLSAEDDPLGCAALLFEDDIEVSLRTPKKLSLAPPPSPSDSPWSERNLQCAAAAATSKEHSHYPLDCAAHATHYNACAEAPLDNISWSLSGRKLGGHCSRSSPSHQGAALDGLSAPVARWCYLSPDRRNHFGGPLRQDESANAAGDPLGAAALLVNTAGYVLPAPPQARRRQCVFLLPPWPLEPEPFSLTVGPGANPNCELSGPESAPDKGRESPSEKGHDSASGQARTSTSSWYHEGRTFNPCAPPLQPHGPQQCKFARRSGGFRLSSSGRGLRMSVGRRSSGPASRLRLATSPLRRAGAGRRSKRCSSILSAENGV